jgi:hypothetical protein
MTHTLYLRSLLALFASIALACGGAENNHTVAMITFEVIVPVDTPQTASLYVVGEHYSLGGLDGSGGIKLHRESAIRFRGSMYAPRGETLSYKLDLRNPQATEVTAEGEALQPRTIAVGQEDQVLTLSVSRWTISDAPTFEPAEVTFVVTVPANTPANAPVYLAGNQPELGGWAPAGFLLTKGDDGKYHGKIVFGARPGSGVSYKVTRGGWDTVEKSEAGAEIADRTLIIPREDTTAEITVARWADHSKL